MKMWEEERSDSFWSKLKGKRSPLAIGIVAAIVLGIFFTTMFGTVDTGYGVLLVDPVSGTISDPILGPTWYVKMPWHKAVYIYYATESVGMWGKGNDPYAEYPAVKCFTKDQLEATIDIMVRWSLDPSKLKELYLSYPNLDWEDRAIASTVRETIRFVTKNFTATEMITKRETVAYAIQEAVFDALRGTKSLKGALIHLEFDLRNIALPGKYMQAIENKMVAEQQKRQAEFERERILILADAEAQQKIRIARAEAESRLIVANATKRSIQMIAQAAGIDNAEDLAEMYLYLEALKEIAPNIDVLIISSDDHGNPVIYSLPRSGK